MSIYNEYSFLVEATGGSGLVMQPDFDGKKVRMSRQFLVSARHAQEFAFRMMGKWEDPGTWDYPQLPAPMPAIRLNDYNLRARSFRMRIQESQNFNNVDGTGTPQDITDPTDYSQLEQYYWPDGLSGTNPYPSCDDKMLIQIDYDEDPADCEGYDPTRTSETSFDIQDGTAIKLIERSAGYEVITVPTHKLVWYDPPKGVDKTVRSKSGAPLITSTQDITVDWWNIPVEANDRKLADAYEHLDQYRGSVNRDWYEVILCGGAWDVPGSTSVSQSISDDTDYGPGAFPPETLLFVDYTELPQERTRCFGRMNTTTIRMHFKYKFNGWVPRVVSRDAGSDPPGQPQYQGKEPAGWNHYLLDKKAIADDSPPWMRIGILEKTDEENPKPLYRTMDWANATSGEGLFVPWVQPSGSGP